MPFGTSVTEAAFTGFETQSGSPMSRREAESAWNAGRSVYAVYMMGSGEERRLALGRGAGMTLDRAVMDRTPNPADLAEHFGGWQLVYEGPYDTYVSSALDRTGFSTKTEGGHPTGRVYTHADQAREAGQYVRTAVSEAARQQNPFTSGRIVERVKLVPETDYHTKVVGVKTGQRLWAGRPDDAQRFADEVNGLMDYLEEGTYTLVETSKDAQGMYGITPWNVMSGQRSFGGGATPMDAVLIAAKNRLGWREVNPAPATGGYYVRVFKSETSQPVILKGPHGEAVLKEWHGMEMLTPGSKGKPITGYYPSYAAAIREARATIHDWRALGSEVTLIDDTEQGGASQMVNPRMTIAEAKAALRVKDMTFNKNEHGEYVVNFRGGSEDTAYYSDDFADALNTGLDMARRRDEQINAGTWKGNPHFPGRLGTGQRFEECVEEMSHRPGVYSPEGLCATIGRRKYGDAGMSHMAHHNPVVSNPDWEPGIPKKYRHGVTAIPRQYSIADRIAGIMVSQGYDMTVGREFTYQGVPQKAYYFKTSRDADNFSARLKSAERAEEDAWRQREHNPSYDLSDYTAKKYRVRGRRGLVSIDQDISAIKAAFPDWTKDEHARKAKELQLLKSRLQREWGEVADAASQATYGRPYRATDYRISGIADDRYPAEYKDKLRELARASGVAGTAAKAHEKAAGVVAMRHYNPANPTYDYSDLPNAWARKWYRAGVQYGKKHPHADAFEAFEKSGGNHSSHGRDVEAKEYFYGGFHDGASGERGPVRNPASEADAVYEEFHGVTPEETVEVVEEIHYHGNLAGLGDLIELKIVPIYGKNKGKVVTLDMSQDGILLSCSEDKTQLYFSGGNQDMPLKQIGLDHPDFLKDHMVLGVLCELTYQTRKKFDKLKLTDYYHAVGEETGNKPMLTFDAMNQLIGVSGGSYKVEARGIVD